MINKIFNKSKATEDQVELNKKIILLMLQTNPIIFTLL